MSIEGGYSVSVDAHFAEGYNAEASLHGTRHLSVSQRVDKIGSLSNRMSSSQVVS